MFESFIKLILHIKEQVCCFVLDGSPRFHAYVLIQTWLLILKTWYCTRTPPNVIPLGTRNWKLLC